MLKENLNSKYWNKYYKEKNLIAKPSKFAIFVKKKLKNYNGMLYDIGCGNGRDVIFFNNKKISCRGIDISKQAILNNKKKFPFYQNSFINSDLCNFFSNKLPCKNFSIYSRFSLHAINYKKENKLFDNLTKHKNLEYLFIESRTLEDDLYGVGKKIGKHEFISSHYRRFIDTKVLKKKLIKNFKIMYFKKSKGFAKFKKEDPCVLRIVGKKKKI